MTLQDFDLLAKLSEGDMIAQDAMYHPLCLLVFFKKAKSVNDHSAPIVDEEKELHGMVLADLVAFIQQEREIVFSKWQIWLLCTKNDTKI